MGSPEHKIKLSRKEFLWLGTFAISQATIGHSTFTVVGNRQLGGNVEIFTHKIPQGEFSIGENIAGWSLFGVCLFSISKKVLSKDSNKQ